MSSWINFHTTASKKVPLQLPATSPDLTISISKKCREFSRKRGKKTQIMAFSSSLKDFSQWTQTLRILTFTNKPAKSTKLSFSSTVLMISAPWAKTEKVLSSFIFRHVVSSKPQRQIQCPSNRNWKQNSQHQHRIRWMLEPHCHRIPQILLNCLYVH